MTYFERINVVLLYSKSTDFLYGILVSALFLVIAYATQTAKIFLQIGYSLTNILYRRPTVDFVLKVSGVKYLDNRTDFLEGLLIRKRLEQSRNDKLSNFKISLVLDFDWLFDATCLINRNQLPFRVIQQIQKSDWLSFSQKGEHNGY
mgnify:CR=1 FL=1